MMSEITTNDRDQKNGRFLPGNNGGGRKPGARNRLGEAFLEDLKNSWNECGAVALKRAAEEDPAAYCRIVAGLLPKDININATLNVEEFASRYRSALEMLGNEPELPKPRRQLRIINHADRSR
jgi:hypothetical protein